MNRTFSPTPRLLARYILSLCALMLLPVLAARAQDNAVFVSQNVPTAIVNGQTQYSMGAGQRYSVSVTMQNTGSTT